MKIYLNTYIPIFANTIWLCCLRRNSTDVAYVGLYFTELILFLEKNNTFVALVMCMAAVTIVYVILSVSLDNMSVLSQLEKWPEFPTYRTHSE